MTHASRSQSATSTDTSCHTVAKLLAQGIDRSTSNAWAVKAVDTRLGAHTESGQLVFEAIAQHDRGDTIQVEPVPAVEHADNPEESSGYAGPMRVRLQREYEGFSGDYVKLQGRAKHVDQDRDIERTLLFYAGSVNHSPIDEWTAFESVGAVGESSSDTGAHPVEYASLTKVIIAILAAAQSVRFQPEQADLSAFV